MNSSVRRRPRAVLAAAVLAVVATATVCLAPADAMAKATTAATAAGVTPSLSWQSEPVTWSNGNGTYLESHGDTRFLPGCQPSDPCNINTSASSSVPSSYREWMDPSIGNGDYYEIWYASWDGSTHVSSASDECLDSNSNTSTWGTGTGHVYVIPCNQGDNQQWWEGPTSTGWYLSDRATGLCLDGGGAPWDKANQAVYSFTCMGNGDSWQRWH